VSVVTTTCEGWPTSIEEIHARLGNRVNAPCPTRVALDTLTNHWPLSYNSLAMIDNYLVPEKTVVTTKGDGVSADLSGATNRVFLLNLNITDIVEQESLDVSIYGSADGAAWGPKPLTTFPQKFYRGQHPLLLDLNNHKDVKFVRAHWEVGRWGRGSETPMFEFSVSLKEVPTDILKEATAEAKALV
jgi:hypothetical protein